MKYRTLSKIFTIVMSSLLGLICLLGLIQKLSEPEKATLFSQIGCGIGVAFFFGLALWRAFQK